jgi:hypothetical protein
MTFLLISIYVYDIGGVMTSMPTSSVLDHGFKPGLVKPKY